MGEQKGKYSKFICPTDINRDRTWPPIATANWQQEKHRLSEAGFSNGNHRLYRLQTAAEIHFYYNLYDATREDRQNKMFYDEI